MRAPTPTRAPFSAPRAWFSAPRAWLPGSLLLAVLLPVAIAPPAAQAAPAAPPAAAYAAVPVTAASYTFEDGTTQGWFARGAANVVATTQDAHGGTGSLLVSARTATWEGPGRDVRGVLLPDATYAVEAYAKIAAGGAAADVQLTVQRTGAGGSTAYERVASGTVTPDGWALLRGEYRFSGEVSELQLYLESGDATASFLVDDVTVTMTEAPPGGPPDEAGAAADFEAGTPQGWSARLGSEILTVTDADAHGGQRSLLTTGRTEFYAGPALNVLGRIGKGKKYTFSAWVKLAPGESPVDVRLSIERRWQDTPTYAGIAAVSGVTADAWVELTGSYTLAADADFLAIYFETASGTASFHLDDFRMTYVVPKPIQDDIPALREVLADDFPIGAAVSPVDAFGEKAMLLAKHFNSVTAGNAMKWDATEPVEGQFTFADADAVADLATANRAQLRGHTLVWHQQTPAWVFQRPDGTDLTDSAEDKALLLARLEAHIRAVAGRYAGRVTAWDVANEVIDEAQPDGMRRSRWFQIAGLDYLRTAFRVARQVDPEAKLVINDYNTEYPRKREALFNLVRQLRAEGVPIDGVGHQLHVNVERQRVGEIEKTIQRFATLGVDQQVTELDMSVYTNFVESYPSIPAQTLAEQGVRYRDLFDLFRRYRDEISSVTVWGSADDGTWLKDFPIPRLDLPLLFDEELQAKPAYWGVVDRSKLPALARTRTVPAGRPVTDGRRDAEWDLLPGVDLHAATGLSTTFQLRWSAKKLHLLAEVIDPSDNRSDAVDVFVGEKRYRISRGGGRTSGFSAAIAPMPGGYRTEAEIPLPAGTAEGARLRVDLRVTDAATGARTSWNDQTHGQEASTDRRGEITLVPAVATADAVRGTPVLDGVAESVWSRARPITTNVRVSGPAGATGTARLLWDDRHLYVFATVADPVLDESSPNSWEQDSIEIFVDPDNSKNTGYTDEDGQYRVSFTNRQTIGGNFDGAAIADNLRSATRRIAGGYTVEAAIELDPVTPRTGSLVGFDLQVNDATAGARTAAATWHDPTGRSYVDTSRWGVTRLVR